MGQEITRPGRPPKYLAIEQARIDAEAAKHRAEGKTYRQIAETVGCDLKTAHTRVQRAIAAVPVEAVEELRAIELARLDEMMLEARRQLLMDHVLVSHGKVITGVVDESAKMAALDRLLRISESRRRLLGLDLPVKVQAEVTVHDGDSELDREIAGLLEAMAGLGQGSPAVANSGPGEPDHPTG